MRSGAKQPIDAVFARIKTRFDEQNRYGLICKQRGPTKPVPY